MISLGGNQDTGRSRVEGPKKGSHRHWVGKFNSEYRLLRGSNECLIGIVKQHWQKSSWQPIKVWQASMSPTIDINPVKEELLIRRDQVGSRQQRLRPTRCNIIQITDSSHQCGIPRRTIRILIGRRERQKVNRQWQTKDDYWQVEGYQPVSMKVPTIIMTG